MLQRFVGPAIAVLALAACGGGEQVGVEQDASAGAMRDATSADDTGATEADAGPTCEEAGLALRTCRARVEAACAPIESRLQSCMVSNITTRPETSRDAARAACAPVARELHDCRSACAPARVRKQRICHAACDEARADAAACTDGFTDCEAGVTRYRNCIDRARTTCASDRDPTGTTDRADRRMCNEPVAFCTHQAELVSDCFATCRGLVGEARQACHTARVRGDGDEPPRERGDGDEPTRDRGDGDEPTRERGDGDEPTRERGDGDKPTRDRGDDGEPPRDPNDGR